MIQEKKFFDDTDADNNGFLNIKEVGSMVDPNDECIIEALVSQFFWQADKNRDKSLSIDGKFLTYF